jgi:large subunit ribosomal protein L15
MLDTATYQERQKASYSATDGAAEAIAAKQRATEAIAAKVVEDVWGLHNLQVSPGSHKKRRRGGRGDSEGNGGTYGFGNRGQKSRSGNRKVKPGFEGGQTPSYRALPKYVGRPMGKGHVRKEYNVIKLDALRDIPEGSEVTAESLLEAKKIYKGKNTFRNHKIFKLVGGTKPDMELPKGLTVRAHGFTQSAIKAIEDNGGKVELIKMGRKKRWLADLGVKVVKNRKTSYADKWDRD